MRAVWKLKEEGASWVQTSTSKLKSKAFHFCAEMMNSLPYNGCIEWSADDMIAYTTVEGIYTPETKGYLSHPIHFVYPNSPSDHWVLPTDHKARIKHLKFSPLSSGQYLVTIDEADKLFIWKMKEGVNDWTLLKSFDMDNVVCIKWLVVDFSRFQLPVIVGGTGAMNSSFEKKFQIPLPDGTPPFATSVTGFFTVSGTGVVTIFFLQTPREDYWSSLSFRLRPEDQILTQVDICFRTSRSAIIAIAGPSLGNAICVYELFYDFFTPESSSLHLNPVTGVDSKGVPRRREDLRKITLVSRICLPPSLFMSSLASEPFQKNAIIAVKFHPMNYNVMMTVTAGFGPEDKSIVTRWEFKGRDDSTPPDKDRSKALLNLSPTFHWVATHSVSFPDIEKKDKEEGDDSKKNDCSEGSSCKTKTEKDQSASSSSSSPSIWDVPAHFVTAFQFFNDGRVGIGFANGGHQFRDGSDLKKIVSCCPPKPDRTPFSTDELYLVSSSGHRINNVNNTSSSKRQRTTGGLGVQFKELSHPTLLKTSARFPVAFSMSPNHSCVVILNNNVELELYALDAEVVLGVEDDELQARRIVDMMELCLLRGSGWWDILLLLREISHKKPEMFRILLPMLIADHKSLQPIYRHYYSPRVEGLKASVYRLVRGQEYNYCDSQARLFIYHVYDTFRTLFLFSSMPKASVSFNKEVETLYSTPELYSMEPDILGSMVPVTEWVLNYAVFLLRNLEYFVSKSTSTEPSTYFNMPEAADYQAYFSLHATFIPSYAPGISFLFDLNFLVLIRELILYSGNVRQLVTKNDHSTQSKLNASFPIQEVKTLTEVFTKLIKKCKDLVDSDPAASAPSSDLSLRQQNTSSQPVANSAAKTLVSLRKDIATILQQASLSNLTGPIWSTPMDRLFQSLDLCAPLLGFLEQNQIPPSSPSAPSPAVPMEGVTKRICADGSCVDCSRGGSCAIKKSGKSKEGESCYVDYKYENRQSVNRVSLHDVVTYQQLRDTSTTRKPFRQCLRCHRKSVLATETTAHWHGKWEIVCPICGGRWKVVQE